MKMLLLSCFSLLFGGSFVLFDSELLILFGNKFCWVVFITSEDSGPSENVPPLLKRFYSVSSQTHSDRRRSGQTH